MGSSFNRFNSWKVLKYSDRLQDVINNWDKPNNYPFPLVWHIYPSNKCHMNCDYCIMAREKMKYPVILPKDILLKSLDDIDRTGGVMVHFVGGGEPYTHPDMSDILQYHHNKGYKYKVAVTTNGVSFNPCDINYINHLRVSLNASTEETHKKIMGAKTGWFGKIVSNIKDAMKYRDDDMYHDIGLAFLVTPDNWFDIYSFVELAVNIGVDFVHVRPAYYPRGNPLNNLMWSTVRVNMGEISKAVLSDFGSDIDIGIITEKFEGYWTSPCFSKCRANLLQCVLTATGEFIVCLDVFKRFGDYTKDSFEECWRTREHKQVIDSIDINKCPRCVETRHNQILEHCFLSNDWRSELL